MHKIRANIHTEDSSLRNCNDIKVLMMLFIVLYHSTLFWMTDDFYVGSPASSSVLLKTLPELIKGLSCHIYVFMLISGYIFGYLKIEKNKYNNFGQFCKNKFMRLIIPYCFVSIVWAIPSAIIFLHFTRDQIVHRFLLAEAPNQLWYLSASFGVFIFFFCLYKLFENRTLLGGILVLLLYILGTLGYHFAKNVFTIWQIFQMLPFFWLGFKLRQFPDAIEKTPSFLWPLCHIIFLVTHLAYNGDGMIATVIDKLASLALYVFGSINVFIIGQSVFSKISIRSRVYDFIRKRTIGVYLFHQQVIYVCLYLFNGRLNPFLIIIVSFISSILVSVFITFILEQTKVTRFFIGEKS